MTRLKIFKVVLTREPLYKIISSYICLGPPLNPPQTYTFQLHMEYTPMTFCFDHMENCQALTLYTQSAVQLTLLALLALKQAERCSMWKGALCPF